MEHLVAMHLTKKNILEGNFTDGWMSFYINFVVRFTHILDWFELQWSCPCTEYRWNRAWWESIWIHLAEWSTIQLEQLAFICVDWTRSVCGCIFQWLVESWWLWHKWSSQTHMWKEDTRLSHMTLWRKNSVCFCDYTDWYECGIDVFTRNLLYWGPYRGFGLMG